MGLLIMDITPRHKKPGMSSPVRHRYICARIGTFTNSDSGFSIKTMGCALIAVLIAITHVKGQDSGKSPLYGHGFFPPGQLYVEGDLQNLIGTTFSEPTYLAGRFVYLGNIQGKETFSNYTQGLLKEGSIAFGRILIQVKFYDNRPPGLRIGKAIVATPTEPLALKSVKLVNGGYLIVEAESWSAP
jgi:hypothetical protein